LSEYKKSKLSNGLTLVTESIEGRHSVHLGFHILWGSRHEPKDMHGAAHLIEHMVFKGTKNRTAFEIVRDIESVGAEIAASTGREMTSYTTQSLKKDLPLCLDVLSDLCFEAEFSEVELEKEKQVVLSEIAMGHENLEESVFDFAFEEIYKNHPLAHPITGTEESVSSMSLDDLTSLYESVYCPDNFVVTAAGDVDHNQIKNILESKILNKNRSLNDKLHKMTKGDFLSFQRFFKKDSEQAHLLLNFPAPKFSAEDRMAAYFVNTALGGGMTSLLFQRIREDLGLGYTVYSMLQCFLEEGVLSIYLATRPEASLLAMTEVIGLLEDLIKTGFNDEQFELYKSQLLSEILMSEDDLDNRMNSLAVNELVYGEARPVEHVVEEVERLSLSAVNSYLKTYMDNEPGVVILGQKSQ